MTEKIETIACDIYSRYSHASEILDILMKSVSRPLVLDVGGQQNFLKRFRRQYQVIIADTSPLSKQSAVQADGLHLPFKDNCFDAAVSLDTLEHIAPRSRETFISELIRTTKKYVVLSCPVNSAEAVKAENLLAELYSGITDQSHAFLKEHSETGLPQLEQIEKIARKLEYKASFQPSFFLPHWFIIMTLQLALETLPFGNPLIKEFNAFYNRCFLKRDRRIPAYRYMIILHPEQESLELPGTLPDKSNSYDPLFNKSRSLIEKLIDYCKNAIETKKLYEEIKTGSGFEKAFRDLQSYCRRVHEEKEALEKENKRIYVDFTGLSETYAELKKAYERLEKHIQELSEQNELIFNHRTSLEKTYDRFAERYKSLEKEHARVSESREELENRLQEKDKEIRNHKSHIKQVEDFIEKERADHREKLLRLEKLTGEYVELSGYTSKLKEQLDRKTEHAKELEDYVHELLSKLRRYDS